MDNSVSLPSHAGSLGLHHPDGLGRLRRLAVSATALCALALGVAGFLRVPSGAVPTTPRSLTVPVGHQPTALALDERDDHLFVVNYLDGTLSLLDARTGALLRTVTPGGYPVDLAVDEAAGRVFILNTAAPATPLTSPPAGPSGVTVLDARTGTLLRTDLPGTQPNALAVDERHDRVFALDSGAETLNVLDARRGGVLATVSLDGLPQAVAVDERAERVYVGSNGRRGHLLVLDSRTGRRLRSLVVGHSVGVVLAVPAAGRVVVSSDGRLLLLDARTGALLSTLRVAAMPLRAGGAGGTHILVTGAAGLRLLDARTGRWCGPWVLSDVTLPPLWSEDVASDPATGDLLVVMQPVGTVGRLALLDGRSGRLLRLLPVGADPVALAFDARTRRAMVLLEGATPAQETGPLVALRDWSHRWLPWLPLPHPSTARPGGSVRLISLR